MEEPVRVRVVFDDRHILTKSQRSEGLKRCWLLLKPDIATISDLASHVTHSFELQRSCPHGLVLSMDDFVLPSFESTCILKDKDIIRVRKKGATLMDVVEIGDDLNCIQDSGNVEKYRYSNKLLAIREFQEELGEHKSKDEEDPHAHNENAIRTGTPSSENTNSKRKRKHADKLQGIKRKKLKSTSSENPNVITEGDENVHLGQNLRCSQKRGSSRKSLHSKDKPSNGDGRPDKLVASQQDDNVEKMTSSVQREERRKKSKLISPEKAIITAEGGDNIHLEQNEICSQKRGSSRKSLRRKVAPSNEEGRSDTLISSKLHGGVSKMTSSVPMEERNDQPEENRQKNTGEPHVIGSATKVQSRNARRTKATRKWLQEINSQKNENIQSQMPLNDIHRKSSGHRKMDQNAEMEEEIVPIVVRPGHIRFEPLDAEQSKQQSQGPMDTPQWNGTTSKKKGQKWGREKTSSKWNDASGYNEQSNGKSIAEEVKTRDGHIDFESLRPLTRLPQEGDVLVYRLVELSSSWCPEVSSFRVGKVSSYDPISMRIILVPLPEYPIFSDENIEGEESMLPANVSPYNEDGSIQIHYPSLVDVRLFKASDSEAIRGDYCGREMRTKEAAPVNNWERALANGNVKETVAPPTENGFEVAWGQIKQALDEKKSQLQKKDGWDNWTPNKSTANTSWSYRALRGSALGPTLALLRRKNGKYAYKK